MTSTLVKCISHQAGIQIETRQSHSSSNVPNNVTNIQSHVTNSNELTCILIFHTQAMSKQRKRRTSVKSALAHTTIYNHFCTNIKQEYSLLSSNQFDVYLAPLEIKSIQPFEDKE